MSLISHGFALGSTNNANVDLRVDEFGQKLQALIAQASLEHEITAAIEYVMANVDATPAGIAVGTRTPAWIKSEMDVGNHASVMASGSLRMMQLKHNALSTLDTARIKHLMTEYPTLPAFKKALGPLAINYDHEPPLCRLNKDAEVHALCLLIYWMKNEVVTSSGADVIFEYMHGGTGSYAVTTSLRLCGEDDKKRQVPSHNETSKSCDQ